jgi:hypothetical protein
MQQDQEFPYFTANLDTVDTNSWNGTTILKAVLAVMDGGSSHSFISPAVLTQVQLEIAGSKDSNLFTRKRVQINGATGSAKSECCITEAKVQLGQWFGEHEFLISGAVTKHDMIMGRDFFKLHKVKIDHESDTAVIDGIQVYINSIHTIASKFFKPEENEFLDTSEPFNAPQVLDQLKKLQQELDELKSFQGATTKVNVTTIEPDKVISQAIL